MKPLSQHRMLFGSIPPQPIKDLCSDEWTLFTIQFTPRVFQKVSKIRVIITPTIPLSESPLRPVKPSIKPDVKGKEIPIACVVESISLYGCTVKAKNLHCSSTGAVGLNWLATEETDYTTVETNTLLIPGTLPEKELSFKCKQGDNRSWEGTYPPKTTTVIASANMAISSIPTISTPIINKKNSGFDLKGYNVLDKQGSAYFSLVYLGPRGGNNRKLSLHSGTAVTGVAFPSDTESSTLNPGEEKTIFIPFRNGLRFKTPPTVLITPRRRRTQYPIIPIVGSVTNVTKRGFRIKVFNADCPGSKRHGSASFNWIAIGEEDIEG